jgi:hypothetical protein
MASEEHKTKEQRTQIAALQSEPDELSAALAGLTRQDVVSMPDYERHVEVAAKGIAERDNHPMPKSVTTPEAFYEIMARAALDAVGFRTLLERLAQPERDLEITQETFSRTRR